MRPASAARPDRTPAATVRLVAAALFIATALLFSRALLNGFVNYDDPDYVTANPHVQAGLTTAGVRWALTANVASNWHPLTWISHMVDLAPSVARWEVTGTQKPVFSALRRSDSAPPFSLAPVLGLIHLLHVSC